MKALEKIRQTISLKMLSPSSEGPKSMRKLLRAFSAPNVTRSTPKTKGVSIRFTNKNRNSMHKLLRAFSQDNVHSPKETIRERLLRQSRAKYTKNNVTKNNVAKNNVAKNGVTHIVRPKPSVIKQGSRLAREKLERQLARSSRAQGNGTRKSNPRKRGNKPSPKPLPRLSIIKPQTRENYMNRLTRSMSVNRPTRRIHPTQHRRASL